MTQIGMHIIVTGSVQGVGFRATVKNYARRQGLKGNVRNLADGNVEINVQGSQDQLDDLIRFLQGGAGVVLGHVTSVVVTKVEFAEDFHGFTVVSI